MGNTQRKPADPISPLLHIIDYNEKLGENRAERIEQRDDEA